MESCWLSISEIEFCAQLDDASRHTTPQTASDATECKRLQIEVNRLRIGIVMVEEIENLCAELERARLADPEALLTEKSALLMPGNLIAPVRGDVPKRPKGALAKADVVNHRFHVRSLFGRLALWPATRSGREDLPTPVESRLSVIAAGNPLCKVMIVEACHPSSRKRATPLVFWKNGTS